MNRGSELIRQQILAIMAAKRISKAELARRIGEDRLWVQKRLNPTEGNKATITADEVPLFADALGVPITDLYADVLPAQTLPISTSVPIASTTSTPVKSARNEDEAAPTPAESSPTEAMLLREMWRRLAALSPQDFAATRRVLDALESLSFGTPPPSDEEQAG